jgi:hypothetical protein
MRKASLKKLFSFLIFLLASVALYGAKGIYIQPYLQNVSQAGIDILWWTDNEYKPSEVMYGEVYCDKTVEASVKFEESVGKFLNKARIEDFEKVHKYKYYVKSGDFISKEYSFKTVPDLNEDISFVVLGDGRTDNSTVLQNHRDVTKMAMKQKPDLAFQLGDMVYSGDQNEWAKFWREVATDSAVKDSGIPFAGNIPYYFAIGNHEIWTAEKTGGNEGSLSKGYNDGNLSTTMARFQAYVSYPQNNSVNPQWEERYYAFKYGPATFIVLDSNSLETNGYFATINATPGWIPGTEQYDWMIEELKKAQEESVFTFVMMHHSPYTRGGHGNPNEVQTGYPLRCLDGVFHKYCVDAVMTSHDHLVERSVTGPKEIISYEELLKDKINTSEILNYFVVGNSGHSARPAASGWENWLAVSLDGKEPYFSKYFYDWAEKPAKYFSFLNVTITKNKDGNWQAVFDVIRTDGKKFDKVIINRKNMIVK